MQKHYFIKNIEKKTEPLSKMVLTQSNLTTKNLNLSEYVTMFMDSEYIDSGSEWKEVVLKTEQGFYLYIRKHNLHKQLIDIDVYYHQEQHNELLVYIKSFINSLMD